MWSPVFFNRISLRVPTESYFVGTRNGVSHMHQLKGYKLI